jgi:hypothetical protein
MTRLTTTQYPISFISYIGFGSIRKILSTPTNPYMNEWINNKKRNGRMNEVKCLAKFGNWCHSSTSSANNSYKILLLFISKYKSFWRKKIIVSNYKSVYLGAKVLFLYWGNCYKVLFLYRETVITVYDS